MNEKTEVLIAEARQAVLTMDYVLAYQGGLVGRLADALAAVPDSATEEHDPKNQRIMNGWLVECVGEHTCGTEPDGYYGAHEPGCGYEPLVNLSELPGYPDEEKWGVALGDMTERAQKAEAERDAALSAIGRVRAIHERDMVLRDYCSECSDFGSDQFPPGQMVEWPCSTIQALDGAPEPEWEYRARTDYGRVAAQGAAPQADGAPKSRYISPSLPGMIRNLWKRDPSENSVRTALKLAGDLIQELIDLKASLVLPSSGVDEDALAEVLSQHVLGEPNGGTASWAWLNCSCRHRIEVAGVTREHVVALGRKHQARAVAEWLKEQG